MSTIGNLELRLDGKVMYASVSSDGYNVYNSIVQLALLHDKCLEGGREEPSRKEFADWLKGPKIFHGQEVGDKLLGGVPCEVVIDTTRRILMHNGDDSVYTGISETSPYTIAGALDILVNRHNYQVLEMEPLALRQQRNKDKALREAHGETERFTAQLIL